MERRTVVLTRDARFHSRPAGRIASAAQQFASMICLETHDGVADCKRVIALMKLAIPEDRILEIVAEGSDELEAVSEIEYIIKNMYWR